MEHNNSPEDSEIIDPNVPISSNEEQRERQGEEQSEDKVIISDEDYTRLESLINQDYDSLSDDDKTFFDANSHLIEDELSLQQSLEQILGYETEDEIITNGSPEEIAQFIQKRDEQVSKNVEQNLYRTLSELDPEIFNALQYVLKGGKSRDFYNSAEALDTVQINDDKIAYSVIQMHYEKKGITGKVLDSIVNSFENKEDLIEHAQEINNNQRKEREESQQKILQERQKEQDRISEMANQASRMINQKIEQGSIGAFVVPLEQRKKFDDYIRSKTRILPNGELATTIVFTQNELDNHLQAEWFRFTGGDLSKLIQRSAATMKAKELKKRIKVERPTGSMVEGSKLSLRDLSNIK